MRPRPNIRAAIRSTAVAALAVAMLGSAIGCLSEDTSGSSTTKNSTNTTGSTTSNSPESNDQPNTSESLAGAELVRAVCDDQAEAETVATLETSKVDEASGLAASRSQPGIWWTHNDSGGKAEIYAFDESGKLLAILSLTSAESRDWEDIAIAVDDVGRDWIYVGDIGDNKSKRDEVSIYKVLAPEISIGDNADDTPQRLKATPERFRFTYPGGARDAEALLVDPDLATAYIIDKDWSLAGKSNVFAGSVAGTATGDPVALDKVGEIDLPPASLVTAADLSPDGSAIAVRAYGSEFLFDRDADQSIIDALSGDPCTGPTIAEVQGEAIAFAADGRSYMTIPEGADPVLHRVRRRR